MCCFFTVLLFFGPRLAFLVYWLIPAGQLRINLVFESFIWPFLGWLFLPWLTLMYVLIYPINGFDWLLLGLAFLTDIAGYGGGVYNKRTRV